MGRLCGEAVWGWQFGEAVWKACGVGSVGRQCGEAVWGSCVWRQCGEQCGEAVWGGSVGRQCFLSVATPDLHVSPVYMKVYLKTDTHGGCPFLIMSRMFKE